MRRSKQEEDLKVEEYHQKLTDLQGGLEKQREARC